MYIGNETEGPINHVKLPSFILDSYPNEHALRIHLWNVWIGQSVVNLFVKNVSIG